MDIITLSSDSEESINDANGSEKKSVPFYLESLHSESFDLEWNDDDDQHPPIEYDIESPKKEVVRPLKSEEKIEDFISPLKPKPRNGSLKTTKSNEDFTPYEFIQNPDISIINSQPLTQTSDCKASKAKPRQKLSQEEKLKEKLFKVHKKLEKEKLREEKKAEQQKQKALKAAFSENQRNLKPEENIKFLKVHIDNEIINSTFGGNVISVLQENNVQYVVESQIKNFTVTWSKKKVEKIINDYGEITESIKISDENVLLLVLEWEKAVELIHRNELLSFVETVKSVYFDKNLTLVIYGIEKYFNYKKNKRNRDMQIAVNLKKKAKPRSCEVVFEEAPSITRDQLEFAVIDLQLIGRHNCRYVVSLKVPESYFLSVIFKVLKNRFLETPEEFSSLVFNITKSLSQVDMRLERQKRQNTDLGWIGTDPHQCVKVDKTGNGLLRLWQQQISQFNAVGSETAQSVVSQYNSPFALVNEYEKIGSEKEGELLLQNIQIRREAGILSTSRRVGPQLSKKIYKFFTSDDPDLEL